MGTVIGVADKESLKDLKRWLLLVDEIAVAHSEEKDWSFRDERPEMAADLDWLSDRGIVFRIGTDFATNITSIRSEGKGVVIEVDEDSPGIKILKTIFSREALINVGHMRDALSDLVCRLICEELRQSRQVDAISLYPPSALLAFPGCPPLRSGDVHRVTINAMPEPDDSTSLEKLLEFRADVEARGKMLALRRWISGIMKCTNTPSEIAEEIEWLLHTYEEYMNIHRMKINRGVLETIITGAAEIAEDLVKVRWGKLAKMPFSVSSRKIELLEAELKAPGREIAYIAHARSEFG